MDIKYLGGGSNHAGSLLLHGETIPLVYLYVYMYTIEWLINYIVFNWVLVHTT